MNDVMRFVSKFFFYLMSLALLVFTASMTLEVAKMLLPGRQLLQYFTLVVFDGGAFGWLLVWLKYSDNSAQKGIAFIMMVLDLLGVGFMVGADLFMGGQQLVKVPENLGMLTISVVILAVLLNLYAMYAYHMFEPGAAREIRMRVLAAKVQEEAERQVEANIQGEAAELAKYLAAGLRNNVLADLQLAHLIASKREGEVIDGKVRDVTDEAQPALRRGRVVAGDTQEKAEGAAGAVPFGEKIPEVVVSKNGHNGNGNGKH